jgi:hypothetical protein
MRYLLMAILSLGVVGGYGSAIARIAFWRGGCHATEHAWHDGRWSRDSRWNGEGRWSERRESARTDEVRSTPLPTPAAVAPAPQVFVIVPPSQAPNAPQTIVVPALPQVAQGAQTVVIPAASAPAAAAPSLPSP